VQTLDWLVVGTYLLAMLLLAFWLGQGQASRRDYYLAGGSLPGWALAVSIIATQCSTNSLLGAPAFVGFVDGGGLVWLQYEIAVPLAMLALALFFAPVYLSGHISIYGFLEERLGRSVRLTASACFLFFRGVATGVTIYGVGSILELITGLDYAIAVLLLMAITIAYDVMGGMKAVVVSDVVQMALLLATVLFSLAWLMPSIADQWDLIGHRAAPLQWDWGVSGNGNYGLWPMLFGGFFLYLAYYGCDQSQAQRLLAARDRKTLNHIFLLNGLLRFPLVLAYCLLGLGLAAYAVTSPGFVSGLPLNASGEPNVNLVFPQFVLREFAPGLAGLAIVGLFAAAMSSIDSALNSLSASTLEDFIPRSTDNSERRYFFASKILTLLWGLFAVALSFSVEHIAPTVLEAINKIGSMANGPLLALFVLAIFRPGTSPHAALAGFTSGLLANGALWVFAPGVSWLWWNVAGLLIALLVSQASGVGRGWASHVVSAAPGKLARGVTLPLVLGTGAMVAVLTALQIMAQA